MIRFVASIVLLAPLCAPGADAPVPSEKLAKHLGPKVLEYLKRVEKIEAYKVGQLDEKKAGDADRVSGRVALGEAAALTKEQAGELLKALLADDTYFRSSSLGTTGAAVGYRLWTDRKECLEASCCLKKGNLRFTLKDAEGKVVFDRGVGGFRDDKASPMRALAAAVFPDDKDIAGVAPKKP
ncbi:hypothetical protein [Gemmata sp.]|uniref:hypothetical protein n=1 Tax=Gemmata sp. TaxID=1914242 RepID=UPI003F6F324C